MGQTRSLTLRYTLPALADLSAILDYIAAHSPQGARRVHARIQAVIDLLLLIPLSATARTTQPSDSETTVIASSGVLAPVAIIPGGLVPITMAVDIE